MFNELKILFSPLTWKQKKLLLSINRKTLSTFSVCHTYYCRNVFGNRFDTMETCEKKLLRNIILGKEKKRYLFVITYEYGNLLIDFDRLTNTITNVVNRRGYYPFDINECSKMWLEKYLKI